MKILRFNMNRIKNPLHILLNIISMHQTLYTYEMIYLSYLPKLPRSTDFSRWNTWMAEVMPFPNDICHEW